MDSNAKIVGNVDVSDSRIKEQLNLLKGDIEFLLPTTMKRPNAILIRQTLNKRIAKIEKLLNE